MTDIALLDALIRFTAVEVPDPITVTITDVRGQIVFIDQSFAKDVWKGAMFELSSGDVAGLCQVVGASAANQLTLTARYYPGRCPRAGDTATLSGGPLSNAVLYNGDPDEIQKAWDKGYRYFATFRIPEASAALKAGGGRLESGIRAYRASYGVEVVVCTKDYTGAADEREVIKAYQQLPVFREQVMAQLFAFGNRASSGINGAGEIHYGEIMLQKPGSPPLKGYVIELDYEIS